MQIGERSDSDLPAIVKILHDVHVSDGYPSIWPKDPEEWLTPRVTLRGWIASNGGRILGHALATKYEAKSGERVYYRVHKPAQQLLEIERLFVSPKARGLGVGAMLLNAATQWILAQNKTPVLTVTEDRLSAIGLYEQSGWQRIGQGVSSWRLSSGKTPLYYRYEYVAKSLR